MFRFFLKFPRKIHSVNGTSLIKKIWRGFNTVKPWIYAQKSEIINVELFNVSKYEFFLDIPITSTLKKNKIIKNLDNNEKCEWIILDVRTNEEIQFADLPTYNPVLFLSISKSIKKFAIFFHMSSIK